MTVLQAALLGVVVLVYGSLLPLVLVASELSAGQDHIPTLVKVCQCGGSPQADNLLHFSARAGLIDAGELLSSGKLLHLCTVICLSLWQPPWIRSGWKAARGWALRMCIFSISVAVLTSKSYRGNSSTAAPLTPGLPSFSLLPEYLHLMRYGKHRYHFDESIFTKCGI